MTNLRQPTFFLSHGGGPWPWLMKEMPFYNNLHSFLQSLPTQLPEPPKSILVISGHWEDDGVRIMTNPQPPMYYDYGGFPEHTYHIQYSAPGNPVLAQRVQSLLAAADITVEPDSQRGFDHGAFTMAYPMYPNANIPMVQLSLHSNYDPEFHLRMGAALTPLRDEGVLIIGSGLSYHNMAGFRAKGRASEIVTEQSREFDAWLQHTLLEESPESRRQKLTEWENAPEARNVHPREDHLIPLMVAAGAAVSDKTTLVYNELFMGVWCSSFRFG